MNRREAEELLPWFVAGTLDAEEMQAVQAFIDNGEIDAEQLAELEFLNESVATVGGQEPAYDPGILQRALSQLDGVAQSPRSDFLDRLANPDSSSDPAGKAESSPGMLARLLERLQWRMTPPLARVAIAAQFVLVLGLVVALTLGGDAVDRTDGYEVVAGDVAGDFTIAFAPTATEQQIRALLAEQQASIVAGPSALGIYTLDVPEGVAKAQLLNALKASPVVRFVELVPE